MSFTTVPGRKAGALKLYALSTCHWCNKTKDLLNGLGVEYYYINLDQLSGEERTAMIAEVKKWNTALSFPVLVIDESRAILGLREDEIREAVGA